MVCDRNPAVWDTLGSPVSSVKRLATGRFSQFFRGAERTSPEDLLHAARVLLWVRWFGLTAAFVEIHYRVDYGSLSHVLNTFYCLGFLAANGYVQWLIRRRGTVKPSWLFALSALDLAAISFSASLSGGFNSPYFPAYYFAVAVFAYVFTAPRLVLPWTTLVAVIYSVLSFTVEPTLDIAGKEEQHLFYRLLVLYAVAAVVSIIAGLERESRRKGLERERELQRQRIELSQTIHDTTAQWAYMIGLGVEGAMELADETQEELKAKLRLVAELSRSAMWELRHPIDGGQIFRGEALGEVLEAHAATFTVITSVPAELVQHGREPPLSIIDRSLLFSIAHNALTNVIRHANAGEVVIGLDCDGEELRLSVSDDGGGLPEDYEARGHGFRNMRADAGRMGGVLEVESDGDGGGTTVTCVVPCRNLRGGE
jgi:signal transduction histidine kinase